MSRPGEYGRVRSWWVDADGLHVFWRGLPAHDDTEDDSVDPLELLTDKQRFVIELRYGLKDGYEYSQRDVAALMGVSRSMVHQHEQAAIKRLEKHLRQPPAPLTIEGKDSGSAR